MWACERLQTDSRILQVYNVLIFCYYSLKCEKELLKLLTASATCTLSVTAVWRVFLWFTATSHVWTEEQVRLLIETYRNRKHLFQRTTLAKTEVWRKIATDMAEFGSLHSPAACQKKWDNLCSRWVCQGGGRVFGTYLGTAHDVCICVLRCLPAVVLDDAFLCVCV